jgi:predicted transcriptional regulator
MTVGVTPEKHKQLKRLAIDREKSVENILREAIDDLLIKYE